MIAFLNWLGRVCCVCGFHDWIETAHYDSMATVRCRRCEKEKYIEF